MDAVPSTEGATCSCSGMRFCKLCEGSDRVVKALLEVQKQGLDCLETVFAKNFELHESQSSCAFAALPDAQASLTMCTVCGGIFVKQRTTLDHCNASDARVPDDDDETTKRFWAHVLQGDACEAHHNGSPATGLRQGLSGLHVFAEMITEEEETQIMRFLDHENSPFVGWKSSQSGRRKQDFGPQANFKKKKLKLRSDVPGMPSKLKFLYDRMSCSVDAAMVSTDTADSRDGANKEEAAVPFHIVESSALEYVADQRANLDPHVDDVWIWGPRVAGISLLSPCIMTFVARDGTQVDVCLPRRAGFLLSGSARYDWLHGIRDVGIPTGARRVSITMRELNPSAEVEDGMVEEVLQLSRTFV